jgi:hypothetical protein
VNPFQTLVTGCSTAPDFLFYVGEGESGRDCRTVHYQDSSLLQALLP